MHTSGAQPSYDYKSYDIEILPSSVVSSFEQKPDHPPVLPAHPLDSATVA